MRQILSWLGGSAEHKSILKNKIKVFILLDPLYFSQKKKPAKTVANNWDKQLWLFKTKDQNKAIYGHVVKKTFCKTSKSSPPSPWNDVVWKLAKKNKQNFWKTA